MKPQATNREILLFTGTGFINRPFCRKDSDTTNNENVNFSMEELTCACWNGMLRDLLPELVSDSSKDKESFIWSIVSGINFLYLTMGTCPVYVEKETSLDPYYFLSNTGKN